MNELDELIQLANGGLNDTVRASNFESYEEAESMESYIMRKQVVDRPTAKTLVNKIASTGQLGALRNQMKKEPVMNQGGTIKVGSAAESVGQFDLVAKRLTATISDALPVPFLGPAIAESGYNGVIVLPSGLTFEMKWGIRDGLPNKLQMIYTKGADSDTIEVTTSDSALPYPSFLAACFTDKFRASNIRYIVGDETAASLAQFKNSVQFYETTTFGKVSSNKLGVASYRNPMNNQKNIIDINGSFVFDKERGFWFNMNATAGLEVTLSMFLEKIFRDTANGF